MAFVGNPKTWVPYVNSKDCSQGFCSLYCPQWCYIISPPPPPFEFPDDNSRPNFSPLVIAIIGILASAFLLVSYYTIISKYCGNTDSSRRREESHEPSEELDENHNPSLHEPWQQAANTGLDEGLIKSITVCKYKKGDGLIEGTDCSVCLSEFQEDESLRLLPKCSHAFHVPCIDTWLKSHSNCPLCRANIIFIGASPSPLPPLVTDSSTPPGNAAEDIERGIAEEMTIHIHNDDGPMPKTPLRIFSNLEALDTIIEIRDHEGYQQFRRSISMDHSCQGRLSVADILRMNQDEDVAQVEECTGGAGSSKQPAAKEPCKYNHRKGVLHCVMSPVVMKRSYSSGRFLLPRQGRVRDSVIPL